MSTESMFEEMKRYVRFDEADARLLERLRPAAAPHFERIARELYDRIREHEEAHAALAGEDQIATLQGSLVRWMNRVCAGPRDEAYFRETEKIGRMHVRIGLPQRYMFTATALIRVALERVADASMGEDARAVREAVDRALDLDLAIMLETYRDDFVARIQNVERLEEQDADRTLQRTEHRYVNAVELARALIVGLDARGTILLWNREAERVTGFARDEVLGRPFEEVLSGAAMGSPGASEIGAAAAASSGPALAEAIETVIQTRAGKLRDVRWQIARVPSGPPHDDVALFAFGRDVTDDNALAARVRQTEKLAAVGTLTAGFAHEIRNPLNGAQLHITILERGLRSGEADPEAVAAVGVVRSELKRLSTLVTEFLDFARPQPLERRPTSLRALCERARGLLLPQAEAAQVRLACQYPATDPILDLDRARMEQALSNIGQNAVEALAPTGGGTVTFRVRWQPRHVVIEVEDDGPGLAPEAPIFDPFVSTKPSGTGLGLTVAHRIVTDHGGSIDVRSGPGETIFRIALPISNTPAVHDE